MGRPMSREKAKAKADECLEYLRFWLNSLGGHTRDKSGTYAPFVLVGTHADMVHSSILLSLVSPLPSLSYQP